MEKVQESLPKWQGVTLYAEDWVSEPGDVIVRRNGEAYAPSVHTPKNGVVPPMGGVRARDCPTPAPWVPDHLSELGKIQELRNAALTNQRNINSVKEDISDLEKALRAFRSTPKKSKSSYNDEEYFLRLEELNFQLDKRGISPLAKGWTPSRLPSVVGSTWNFQESPPSLAGSSR
jgi:hypothetical protein